MFGFFSSSIFTSPILIILLALILIARKKKDKNKWEEDILLNSFSNTNNTDNCNDYLNKDQEVKADNIASDMEFYFENRKLRIGNSIIFKNNRYYISLKDFKETSIFNIEEYGSNATVYYKNRIIRLDYKNNRLKDETEKCFRVPSIYYRNLYYVSLIDIAEMFNLKTCWNYEGKLIKLYHSKDDSSRQPRKKLKKPALLRLEDVTAGVEYDTSEALQKLRIIADLLYSRSLPFHIAWIPRYKKPKADIDNDLLKNFIIYNADFIFTLDYMINRGGIVGLHGYTHQHEDGESVEDSEFGLEGNPSTDWAEERAAAAIATAKQLNIPYYFFESPHYSSTILQQKIFEKYFNYIFEPAQGVWNDKPYKSINNNRTIYVPAPWGYVEDNNIDDMLKRIRSKSEDQLGALFYHPYKEFDYIKLSESGYPVYEYSEEAMLKQILSCLEEEKYSMVKITDIK